MTKILLLFSILLMVISSGCNNPSGGSVVSRNHTPLLKPPGAFTFSKIQASNGNVTLKWLASARASEYKIFMGTSSSDITTPVTGCTPSTRTCSLSALDTSTIYYFSIDAVNAAGTKKITSSGSALSVGTFDITSSTVGDGQITLAWSPSAGATSYNVIYGTSSGSYSETKTNITSPYVLTGLSNGINYHVRVVASNAYNGYLLSSSEESASPYGPPSAPTGLVLTAGQGKIDLDWNDSPAGSTYKIFRGTSSGTLSELTSGVVSSYFTDTTTTDGTSYFYAVKAYNGFDSSLSSEASARSITAFNMTAVNVGPAAMQLTVSWPATAGAASYNLIYGTNPAALNLTATNVTSPHILSSLSGGSTYYFKVVAKNAVGLGTTVNSSNQLSATPIAPVGAPTGLVASATPGQIVLDWANVAGASNYEVLRGTTSGSYTSLQSGIVGSTYTDSAVTNGTAYYYVVRSYNGLYSVNSSEVAAKPIQSFILASVTPASSTSLQIVWGAALGAGTYDVLYGTTSGTYTGTVTGVTAPYILTGLSPNTTYYVVVRGKNTVGSGTSLLTAQSSALTKTSAPTALVATTSSGQISLDWANVGGASSYNVYRGTTSGTYSLLTSGLTSSDHVDSSAVNGTTYFYVVTALNGSESANSAEVSARSIATFTITSTTAPSPNSITVNWPVAVGAASYDIKYGTSIGTYTTTLTNKTSPFTITGLTSGVTYHLIVVAKNAIGAGSSQNSEEISQGTPMGAPTGMLATVANGQITVGWNAVGGVTSYKIYRGTTSGTYSLLASNHVPTNFVDTSVVDGTTYYYVVKSYNGADSADSSEVSGKSIADFALTSVVSLSPTSLQVSFPATTGGDMYDVRYGTATGTYTTTATAVTSPYTITALSANTTYYVVARARNAVGSGASRSTAEVSIKTPTAAPTSLVATASSDKIDLSWAAVAGATNYKVYRGTVSGTYSEIAAAIPTTSYSDTTVSNGTTYYYVVKAFNGIDSGNSLEVTAQSITGFSIAGTTSPSPTSIQVSWSNTQGATAYDVLYGTTSGSYSGTALNQTPPYTITGLTANTNYYIVIRAKNTIGAGANIVSAEISQKTSTAPPTSLVATASPGQVGLNWIAAAGATSYKIYRGTVSGTYTEIATGVATLAYLDTTVTDGTTNFYAVKANNGSDSAYSNEVSVRPIGTFTLGSAVAVSSTSVNLTWDSATGSTSYDVRYGTSPGVYLTTDSGATSPHTLSGLTAGTTYYVSVRAKNSVGLGTNLDSNERNFITATPAPTTLSAQAATGHIDLNWTAASGATNYRILRGTASGTYAQIATGVTGTTYSDTTITDGTQYYYVVRAFNGTESPNSSEVTAQSIAAFTISSVTAQSTSSLLVTWSGTAGASAYDVQYGTTSGSYTTLSNVTSPYSITGLSGGTNYFVVVRARNIVGSGSSSQTPEVSQVTPLAAPTGLSASATPGSVALNWTTVSGAASYKVYRGTSSGSYSALSTGVATNSYTDSTAVNGTTYYYAVTAFNGADSANSNETSIRPITNFSISSATALTATSIEVTWPEVTGAAIYDIKYGTISGTYSTTLTAQTTPKTITGLSPGSTYYFVVTAKNAEGTGTSVDSGEVGATTAFGAPTGLAASAISGQVNLSWTNVSGASSYKILRGTVTGTYSEIAAGVGTNSYSDTTITNGTTYYYVVRAFNGADSANSNETSIRAISSFTFSTAAAASDSSLTLTWTAATGAASYDVRYGTSTGSYLSTASGVSSPYTLTGLSAGTTYYISIRAKNAVGSGTSIDTTELNAKTSPGAPSGLAATASTGQVALSWSAAGGATNYNIYRGSISGTYAQIASAVATTNYNDTSITNGTQYFYVVRANNGTESANSNEATGKSIAAFTISSTSAPSTSSVQVTWPAPAGAATYDIRYGNATGSYTTTLTNVTSPYTISGLSAGTNYYIVVRAVNAIGSGSTTTSAEVSQVTPLGAPASLAATSTPASVSLTWSSVASATSYKVYRGLTSGSYSALATGVLTTTYIDTTAVNGTTYFYVVKAYNGADSADSVETSARSISNFTIASTSSPSSTSVQVTWSAPAGGATYDVRYGTATGSYSTTVTGQTSPYTITGLNPGTTYYIVVKANNAVGSGATVTSSESSQLTALGAPTGLAATASPGQVGLNWTNMGGASSYKVYRGLSSGSLSLLASGVASNAYLDTTVSNGTAYYYAVRAFNGSDSTDSSEVAVQPLSSFTLTAASAASASTMNLTWGTSTGASSYDVRYGLAPGVYLGTVSGVTSPYVLTGLTSGTTYYISIQAKNAVGAGSIYNSNEMNAKTAVGAPSGLAATATPGNAALTWSAVSGATNYNIYRGTSSGTYSQIASSIAATSYSDNTVSNGVTYYYMVRSYNGIESANSSEIAISPISTFTLASATPTSSSAANLTWGSATGAATYDIEYGTSSGNYSTTLTSQTSPYSLTGLSAAITYYLRIRAKNNVGSGTTVVSNELSFTTSTAAPTTLAATAVTGQINLTWTATSGATNYRIYRGILSGIYTMIDSGILTTNYTDSTIINGLTYYYVIRAFNGTESVNSNEASASSISSFSISSVTPLSTTSLQVAWPATTGATLYDVRYGPTTGNYTTTASSVTSPYTISGLTAGSNYFIIVRARNSVGGGASINTPEVSQVTPVAAPTGLSATGGSGQVNLTWVAASGATSYKILRGVVSGTYSQIASGITGTSYLDATAVNGTSYYYALKSFNGADSATSTEVFKQPISSPSISGISGNSSSTIQVNWGAATGAASYDLKYGTTSGSYSTTLTGVTSPYTVTGLTSGQTYFFQIVAKNTIGGGTSVNSAESSGAPNSPPVLSSVVAQTMEADTSLNVDFTLSDNNHILTCAGAMSASSSNTGVLQNSGVVFSGSIPNCTATVTPVAAQVGTSTVTLSATDGVSPVSTTFQLTVSPCSVASIVWENQPTGMAAGNLFGTAPRVSLRKANNSLCTTNFDPVVLDIFDDNSPQGDAAITGTASIIPSGGYALFNAARMTRAGTAYSLFATQGDASSAGSNTFNVTAGAANKLVWEQDPLTSPASATIVPSPIVRVADTYGNYVNLNTHSITVSLMDNTEGATFGGTKTKSTNSSGSSTFNNLTISAPGSYYMRATSGTYGTVDSDFFDIISIIPQTITSVMELLQGPIIHASGTNTYYRRGSLSWGTTQIDGTTTYTWKVVATNTSGSAASVMLTQGTSLKNTITVPANTTTPTLFTSTISNANINTGATWRLRLTGTTTNVYSSTIFVKQVGAGKTQVYIPMSSIENTSTTGYVTTSSTTPTVPNDLNFYPYSWDETKIGRIDSALLWFAFASGNSGASACAALYNKTTNTIIGTERCSSTTTETTTSVAIAPTALPADAEIEIRYRTTNALYPAKIYKGGLLLKLVNIENMVAIQTVARAKAVLNASTNFVETRITSKAGDYGTGLVNEYVNCYAKALTAGTGAFVLKDNGTNTNGTTSPTNISASNISVSNQSSQTNLEAGPVATTHGNNMYLNYTHTSGSYQLSGCLFTTESAY